jgi:hypothetical protein
VEQVAPVSAEEALLGATHAYLASPQALADADLVTYASTYPLTETLARPGGCDAWFRDAQLPGQSGDPAGEPPGGEVFDRLAVRLVLVKVQLGLLAVRLVLVKVQLGLLAVRCATDQHVARLPDDLHALPRPWDRLAAFAVAHDLTMPVADPAPPRLPPAPVRYTGDGQATIEVHKPVDRPGGGGFRLGRGARGPLAAANRYTRGSHPAGLARPRARWARVGFPAARPHPFREVHHARNRRRRHPVG